jgi:hypothetical protein
MAEAVFGLIGVVIGGFLTGLVSYLLEARREKKEARVARRLARSDLGEAEQAVSDALSGQGWPAGWTNKRWSDSWSAHRQPLAGAMNDNDFGKLARAALYVELLQVGLSAGKRPFIEGDEQFLTAVATLIRDADRLLSPARAPERGK